VRSGRLVGSTVVGSSNLWLWLVVGGREYWVGIGQGAGCRPMSQVVNSREWRCAVVEVHTFLFCYISDLNDVVVVP